MNMSSLEAARLDAWITREPPEPEFDCECEEDHDDCDVTDCPCEGHDNGCSMCRMPHGCICDDLYERHKDRRLENNMGDYDDDY